MHPATTRRQQGAQSRSSGGSHVRYWVRVADARLGALDRAADVLPVVVMLKNGGSCRQHNDVTTSSHVSVTMSFGHPSSSTQKCSRKQQGAQKRSSGGCHCDTECAQQLLHWVRAVRRLMLFCHMLCASRWLACGWAAVVLLHVVS